MANDRTVRRLTMLEQTASSARVLNLVAVHRRYPDDAGLAAAPLFRNRLLDRSILLKHRLRPHEYALFDAPRPTVTKLLIPIDGTDLKFGARSAFIGQRDFDTMAEELFGGDLKPGSHDRQVLEVIDSLPSLDPFLLREQLKRNDIEPARHYFGISDADIQRMHDFVREEVMALVHLSSKDGKGSYAYAQRLVGKLLSSAPESGFEPLKETLKLSDQEYLDGVFAWRGFLYYKWTLSDLITPATKVATEIMETQPRGPRDQEASAYLPEGRSRVQRTLSKTIGEVRAMLDVYDKAYGALTKDGQPGAFRDFLLKAPDMFASLGEQLGAVQHITSFWRYRFPANRPRLIAPDELMDLFLDFEDSLSSIHDEANNTWVA